MRLGSWNVIEMAEEPWETRIAWMPFFLDENDLG